MNRTLRQLMEDMDAEADARLRRPWSSAILHSILGPVPSADLPAGSYFWNRGFLLLLLDDRGRPTHICKVRPEAEQGSRHEGRVMRCLASDAEVGEYLPPSYWSSKPGIQILVTAFVPGRPYEERVTRVGTPDWATDMDEVLRIAEQMSRRAAALMPDLLGGDNTVRLADAAAPGLESLVTMGMDAGRVRLLEDRLVAACRVPATLQHGDLWPDNLLYHEATWQLLDFEVFGAIRAPMFDAIHLLRTSMDARTDERGGQTWIAQLQGSGADALACRRLLRAAARRAHLDPGQAVGALIHYLAAFIRRCHLVGLHRRFVEPLVAEVCAAADLLAEAPSRLDGIFREG